jgi:hypothetical protein
LHGSVTGNGVRKATSSSLVGMSSSGETSLRKARSARSRNAAPGSRAESLSAMRWSSSTGLSGLSVVVQTRCAAGAGSLVSLAIMPTVFHAGQSMLRTRPSAIRLACG